MHTIADTLNAFAPIMWSTALVVLLVGGGVFFLVHSHARPDRYFGQEQSVVSDESGQEIAKNGPRLC